MTKKLERIDSTERSMLLSDQDIFKVIGEELGRLEDMLEYRRLFDEASQAVMVQDYPIHIDFELNFLCNLKCKWCILSLPDEERAAYGCPDQTISFESFAKVIDEGMEHGLRSVAFNGNNEPLTVRGLDKYIAYARDKGIVDIIFNTNGLLMTREVSAKLIESGMTRVMISLDSFSEETYSRFRVGGNYKRVVKNVLDFLELRKEMGRKLPIVRLSYIVHSKNIHEIENFARFWHPKVDLFALQSLRDPFMYHPEHSKKFRELFDIDPECILNFYKCPQPYQRLFIRYNGDALPCCGIYGMKQPVGNIYKKSVHKIFNDDAMQKIRESVNDEENMPEPCIQCRKSATRNYDLKELKNKFDL